MDQVDIVIIGAGVVGLAIGAKLSETHKDASIVIMDKYDKFGQETSSRNSEVIHSGIYYPTDSLKAKLCVQGNKLLYSFCEKYKVPHNRMGKLIIARNNQEIAALEGLMQQGAENGVYDLEMLDKDQVSRLEPDVCAVAAILSPSTGIVDSHLLMERLEALSKQNDVLLAYGHEVTQINVDSSGYILTYKTGGTSGDRIQCKCLINCAGLNSDKIAEMLGIDIDNEKYRIYPCKGEYFSIRNSKADRVKHLVYPPPLKNLKGLGIHVTKSMDGYMRLGPNAFYVDTIDYDVDISHGATFFEAVKDFLPFLNITDIETDMAGIRPKVQGPEDPVRDFVISHEAGKNLPGVINLIGIESPGLTSCLSIAEYVGKMLNGIFSV